MSEDGAIVFESDAEDLLLEDANGARDAFAHHALGHAYAMQGQIESSLDALQRGVELAPFDPMANGCYAMQLAASREDDVPSRDRELSA